VRGLGSGAAVVKECVRQRPQLIAVPAFKRALLPKPPLSIDLAARLLVKVFNNPMTILLIPLYTPLLKRQEILRRQVGLELVALSMRKSVVLQFVEATFTQRHPMVNGGVL
jgi:hypothetical protein